MSGVTEYNPREYTYRIFLESLLDVIAAHNCILNERFISSKSLKAELPELVGQIDEIHRQFQNLTSDWKDHEVSCDLKAILRIVAAVRANLLWFDRRGYRKNAFAIICDDEACNDKSKEAYAFSREISERVRRVALCSLYTDRIEQLKRLTERLVTIIKGRYRIVYGSIHSQMLWLVQSLKTNIETIANIQPELLGYLRGDYANLSPQEDPEWAKIKERQLAIAAEIESVLNPYLSELSCGNAFGICPTTSIALPDMNAVVYRDIFLRLRGIYYEVFHPVYRNEIESDRNYPRPITI